MTTEPFGTDSVLIPDLPAPIVGYRAWTWDRDKRQLVGFGHSVWPTDGPLLATCEADPYASFSTRLAFTLNPYGTRTEPTRPAPCVETPCATADAGHHAGHGCGIYAYDTLEQFAQHGSFSPATVWGKGELGGKVYEHKHGWRAEYGEVVAIYSAPAGRAAAEAAEAYGVPLIPLPISQSEMNELRRPVEKPVRSVDVTISGDPSGLFDAFDRLKADMDRLGATTSAPPSAGEVTDLPEDTAKSLRWSLAFPLVVLACGLTGLVLALTVGSFWSFPFSTVGFFGGAWIIFDLVKEHRRG